MVITFIREELKELLGVSERNLRAIVNRGQLENRIKEVGYKLINSYKDGRNTIYELERLEVKPSVLGDVDTFEELQTRWKVRKKGEHKVFVTERISEDGLKKSISNIKDSKKELKDIGITTLKRWNEKLVDEDVIKHDGYVYFKVYNDGTREECTKEDFNKFWKDNGLTTYMINKLHYAKERNVLSKSVCEDEIDDLKYKMRNNYGYIVRRYSSYAEAEQMERFKAMLIEQYNKRK